MCFCFGFGSAESLDNKIDCAVAAITDGKTLAGAFESALQQSVADGEGGLSGGKAVLKGVGGYEEMRFDGRLILWFHSRLFIDYIDGFASQESMQVCDGDVHQPCPGFFCSP